MIELSAAEDFALAVGSEDLRVPTPEDKLVEDEAAQLMQQALDALRQALPGSRPGNDSICNWRCRVRPRARSRGCFACRSRTFTRSPRGSSDDCEPARRYRRGEKVEAVRLTQGQEIDVGQE